jgi:hypothetical protein
MKDVRVSLTVILRHTGGQLQMEHFRGKEEKKREKEKEREK